MDYVIIGNGTAAVACAEAIRTRDKAGAITMISAENRHTYSRPLISYKLLGRVNSIDYRPRDFYKKNGITFKGGVPAQKIDRKNKTVILQNGEEVPYGKLLIAVGSRPFVPPIEGLGEVKNVFTFMSADDMEGLEKQLSADKRVLIVGAGLIGLKCAEGILQRVKKVTVVDMADRILSSVLDKDGSNIIMRGLEELGVEFFLSDGAQKFQNNSCYLKSGAKIDFDLLVMAVGVKPNTELFKEAGLEVNRGAVIDKFCRTSDADIYAAGDCAEGFDLSRGANSVLALLPNAYFQGKCAGENMAGGNSEFSSGIPMNAVGFFGSHVLTAGSYDGEAVVDELTQNTCRKLFVKDGRLSGFILVNDFARAGIYTSLIKNATPLEDIDLQILKNAPSLLAFAPATRAKMLGEKV